MIGIDANQLSSQYLTNLQSIVNTDATSIPWGTPQNFGQKQVDDLLALGVNRFFQRTDEAQTNLDGLFHTTQARSDVSLIVASTSKSVSFNPNFQMPYLPSGMLLDAAEFKRAAVSIDRASETGLDDTEKFAPV